MLNPRLCRPQLRHRVVNAYLAGCNKCRVRRRLLRLPVVREHPHKPALVYRAIADVLVGIAEAGSHSGEVGMVEAVDFVAHSDSPSAVPSAERHAVADDSLLAL